MWKEEKTSSPGAGEETPSLVVWVPAALVRLNCPGSSEAPRTWEGERRPAWGLGAGPGVWPTLGSGFPPPPPTACRLPARPHRYLGAAPGRAGALATDPHAEALEAAVRVAGAQVERAGDTLVAQTPHHVVLRAQSWELQDGPQEGLPGASGFICPPSGWGPKAGKAMEKALISRAATM